MYIYKKPVHHFMNIKFAALFLSALTINACSSGPTKQVPATIPSTTTMSQFEYKFKAAHPNAKVLMTDDFYWSPIEETSPFGNDDGFDAGYGFREWRLSHKATSPVQYLEELIQSWGYAPFDFNEMDTAKILAYISAKPTMSESEIESQLVTFREILKNSPDGSGKEMSDDQLRQVIIGSSGIGDRCLLGIDNAIVAIGFAQFVMEGEMDKDMQLLTATALKRQLLPMLISRYDVNYQEKRKTQLTKMLDVVNRIG
jgi:uncharacterized protein YfeS